MSFFATRRVFFRSMATVIGPTPPGTGVIKPAFFFTSKRKEKKALAQDISKAIVSLQLPSWQGAQPKYCRIRQKFRQSPPTAVVGTEHSQDQGCRAALFI